MAQEPLSDGFVSLCISTDANWYGKGCRILVEGQMTSDGIAKPNDIIEVTGTREIEKRFGVGSVLSETLKTVFCTAPSRVSVFALPRVDIDGSIKAEYQLTVSGTATTDGRVMIYWGNASYGIDVRVFKNDTAAEIAEAIAAAIPESFPFSASVSEGIVTLVAKNAGTIGNKLQAIYNWTDKLNIAPEGVTLALVQTVEGKGNPQPKDYSSLIGQCCYSGYILSSDDEKWQRNLRDHIRKAWDCSAPQCFGHGYVYHRGSIGEILATGDNSAELSRMAICDNDPILPYLKNAAYGALSCFLGCTNPEINVQGQENGLLGCVKQPQTCDTCWKWDEIVQLMDNGFVVTGPSCIGSGSYTNPYVYNDVTNFLFDEMYRENATYRDVSSRRLAAATAVAFAKKLQEYNSLSAYTKNTSIPEGVYGTNPRLMQSDLRAWKKQYDGILFSTSSNLEDELILETDFDKQPACLGKPGVFHVKFQYRPPVRITKVNVGLVPQMLENCAR